MIFSLALTRLSTFNVPEAICKRKKFGEVLVAFGPDGLKLHALYFSFAFGGTSVQSGELTVPKPRKITRDNTEKRR